MGVARVRLPRLRLASCWTPLVRLVVICCTQPQHNYHNRSTTNPTHRVWAWLSNAPYPHCVVNFAPLWLREIIVISMSVCRSVCCVTFAESEPYCHSILFVCLDVCRSFRDLQPTTIDRSQPNLVGRYLSWDPCKPFWIPYLPYVRCQRENMQNFAYRSRHSCCDGQTVGRASGWCGCSQVKVAQSASNRQRWYSSRNLT